MTVFFQRYDKNSMYVLVMGGRSQLRIPQQQYAYEQGGFNGGWDLWSRGIADIGTVGGDFVTRAFFVCTRYFFQHYDAHKRMSGSND